MSAPGSELKGQVSNRERAKLGETKVCEGERKGSRETLGLCEGGGIGAVLESC